MKWHIADKDEVKQACYALREAEYTKYYRNFPKEFFFDEMESLKLPDDLNLSTTVYVEHDNDVIGTVRVTFATYPKYNLISGEVLPLVHLPDADLQAAMSQCGTDETMPIGEVGRLAISGKHRSLEVIQTLFYGVGSVAEMLGMKLLITLATRQVALASLSRNIQLNRFAGAYLDRSKPDNLRFFFQFYNYFFPNLPKSYPDICHPAVWENLSYDELLDIVRHHKDGSHLYWIKPQTHG